MHITCFVLPPGGLPRCLFAARPDRFDAYEDGVADEFLQSLGAGRSQPGHLVRLARALHSKHPNDPTYAWWASLGGAQLTNVERDLRRRTRACYGQNLEPFMIPITLATAEGDPKQCQLACLAPYEVFAAIHASGPQFAISFLGDDGPRGAHDYWTKFVVRGNVNPASEVCGPTSPESPRP